MNEPTSITSDITPYHYLVLCFLIFIFQFFSKFKENTTKVEDYPEEDKNKGHNLMVRYILVFQTAKAADWCLGPFVFEFFQNFHGLTIPDIGKLQAFSYLSNLLLGPFLVGYLNDKSNKRISCIIFSIVLVISCLVRMIKHPACLIISQLFFGCASSILYTSFENWLNAEAIITFPNVKIRELVLSSIFEKSIIFDSIIAVSVAMITGKLNNLYGIQTPYFFSCILCLISFFLVLVLVPNLPLDNDTNEGCSKSIVTNFIDGVKCCIKNPFLAVIGFTESLLFSCLHIFIFVWTPVLKSLSTKCDTGHVFTLFMIALIVGGIAFKALFLFLNSSLKMAKIVSFLVMVSFLIINLSKDFQLNLWGFLLFEISIGLLFPTYSMIKSEYIPQNLRGTLMSLFKVPLHLIVILLILTMETVLTLENLLFVNLVFSSLAFLIHLTCFTDKPALNEKKLN